MVRHQEFVYIEMISMTGDLIEKLRESFKYNADKVFLIDSLTNLQFTYREIEDLSLRFAKMLEEKEIRKGDKVAVFLPNCIEFILLYFACMQIGAIPIPINQKLTPEEIDFILRNSDAKCLFISKNMEFCILDKAYSSNIVSFIPSTDKEFSFLNAIKNKDKISEKSFVRLSDDDLFIIIYTSGTTKYPKGVMVPYSGIIQNALDYSKIQKLDANSRFYQILSLSYMAGFYNLMILPFLIGGSVVLDQAFGINTAMMFWKKIEKYSINVIWLVPSMVSMILTLDRSDEGIAYCQKGCIKSALIGTAPLPKMLKMTFEKKYSISLYENYGSTEALFVSTNSPLIQKNDGVGMPLPGQKVYIQDIHSKNCAVNQIGEIVLQSERLMKGYYKNIDETNNNISNGLFYTGDMGYFDENGHLFIVGRKKDLIIRGGINISPKEIEDTLEQHPVIKEVAVIGIPNELKGEKIIAIMLGDSTQSSEELKKYCLQYLAAFKIPEEFIFINSLPKSVTGKIQKNKLKEMYLAGSF